MNPQTTSVEIVRAVAAKHGVEFSDLVGKERSKRLWTARRDAIIALREAKISLGRIAYVLRRGKSTIDYYINHRKDSARSKQAYADKNGKSVRLDPEITKLVAEYAGNEGIDIRAATNALLRGALGVHA